MSTCSADEGCDAATLARGLCNKHYRRLMRHGYTERQRLRPLSERFFEKVQKTDDCWLWLASKNGKGKDARPVLRVGGRTGRTRLASHVAWFLEYGSWPSLQLNHHCDNGENCVRPDHMYDGTQAENMRDMVERGDVCMRGHPRTVENTQYRKNGTRYCKRCQYDKRRARCA